jgi:dihydroxyacid dehydratase/phosphogluconate dehydratase
MDTRVFDKSKLSSRHVTEGTSRAPQRSYGCAMELTRELIHQTLTGAGLCWNEAAPCNISLLRQAQAAKRAVAAAGGGPSSMKTLFDYGILRGDSLTVTGLTVNDNLRKVVSNRDQGVNSFNGKPAAARGFCAVRDGDVIEINAVRGTIDLLLGDAELEQRKKDWRPRKTNFGSRALSKYAQMAGPAAAGAAMHPGALNETYVYAEI